MKYLPQRTKKVCVTVQKIQYMPQETKIICTCYMHFKEPKMHSCVNYSLPLVLVLRQINKTTTHTHTHMKMKKCFIIKQQTDLKLPNRNQTAQVRIILKWINTIHNMILWTDSVGFGWGQVADSCDHSASKKVGNLLGYKLLTAYQAVSVSIITNCLLDSQTTEVKRLNSHGNLHPPLATGISVSIHKM